LERLEVKRGDVVLVLVPSEPGRPRPGVVVQAEEFNEELSTIFICPVSSNLQARLPLRPIIEAKPSNGLRFRSQIMTDKMVALRRDPFGGLLAASTLKRPNNWTARSFWSSAWRSDEAAPASAPLPSPRPS
jgi:mRNA interferase MazF